MYLVNKRQKNTEGKFYLADANQSLVDPKISKPGKDQCFKQYLTFNFGPTQN